MFKPCVGKFISVDYELLGLIHKFDTRVGKSSVVCRMQSGTRLLSFRRIPRREHLRKRSERARFL